MPDVPTTAKKPSDRKPRKTAQKAEASLDDDIVFDFEGHDYVIPKGASEDVEILELLEDDQTITLVRQILGRQQWAAWKDRYRRDDGRVDPSKIEPFLTAMFDAIGGEDGGSGN